MTTIETTVKEEVEETKTVKVCDMCGLDESVLPQGESIHQLAIGETGYTVTYHLNIVFHSRRPEDKTFADIDDAEEYIDEQDEDDIYSIDKSTEIEPWSDEMLDACDHCLDTFLSAWDGVPNI